MPYVCCFLLRGVLNSQKQGHRFGSVGTPSTFLDCATFVAAYFVLNSQNFQLI